MGITAPFGVAAAGLPDFGDQASNVVSGILSGVGPGDPFVFRGPMDISVWGSLTGLAFTTTKGSLTASVSSGTGLAAGISVNSANVPAGTTYGTFSGTSGALSLPAVTYPASRLSSSSALIYLPPGSNVGRLLGATVTVPSNNEQVTLPANTTVLGINQLDVPATRLSPGQPGIVELSAMPVVVPPLRYPEPPLRFQLTDNAIVTGVDAAATFTGAGIVYSATVQLERSFDGGRTWLVCNIGGDGTLAVYNSGTPLSLSFAEPEKSVLYRINCVAYASGTINYRISQTAGATESLGGLMNG